MSSLVIIKGLENSSRFTPSSLSPLVWIETGISSGGIIDSKFGNISRIIVYYLPVPSIASAFIIRYTITVFINQAIMRLLIPK